MRGVWYVVSGTTFGRQNKIIIFCYMSDIRLESKEIELKMLSSEEFSINSEDLKFIYCDGKQCDPTICLRTSCKVFEYWRNKKE